MCEDPEAVVGQSISQLRSSLSLKHAIYRQQVPSSAFGIISIIIIRSDPAVADTRTGLTETPLECWPEPTDNGPVRAGLLQKHNASYRSVRLCYITCNGLKRPCPVPLSREGESARRYCPGQQQSWGFVGHSHSTNTHTHTRERRPVGPDSRRTAHKGRTGLVIHIRATVLLASCNRKRKKGKLRVVPGQDTVPCWTESVYGL